MEVFNFAVQYKYSFTDSYILSIRDIPQLPSITMSFWIRIPGDISYSGTSSSYQPMVAYYNSKEMFSVDWRFHFSDGNTKSTFMETQITINIVAQYKLWSPGYGIY